MANKGLISLLFTAFLLINCNAANANERKKKPTFQGPSMYHKNGILGRN
ncbi:hypothetical protein CCACVL1_07722 [Corchorus capsularis]|uniref:Uncharacterized protein n=1 Tax=Corchorus capsularis TaxID=210143 RepID=A0A1R3J485_COCAP|nr:hypothetical protein CCACVL1_07722 [Corchorus capsularis]